MTTIALRSPAVAWVTQRSASLQVAQLPSLKPAPESDLDEHHLDSLIASIDMADATIWTSALFDRTKLPLGPVGEGKEKRLTVLSSIDQPALVSMGSPLEQSTAPAEQTVPSGPENLHWLLRQPLGQGAVNMKPAQKEDADQLLT